MSKQTDMYVLFISQMHFYCSLWKASSRKENICVKQRHARKKGLALHSKWTDVIVKKHDSLVQPYEERGRQNRFVKSLAFPNTHLFGVFTEYGVFVSEQSGKVFVSTFCLRCWLASVLQFEACWQTVMWYFLFKGQPVERIKEKTSLCKNFGNEN